MSRIRQLVSSSSILALLSACLLPGLSAETAEGNSANAIVTSVAGKSHVTPAEGKQRAVSSHETHRLINQKFETEKNSHLFLVSSNGLGIGIDADTSLHFKTHQQLPFVEKRANLEYEPSVSELIMELSHGAVSLTSDGLSPRSNIRVVTPNGTLRLHTIKCRIEQDDTGTTTIISYDGNATFYFPDGETRQFISKNTVLRISPQSAANNKIAAELEIESLEASKRLFSQATTHASERVFFQAPQPGQAAIPMLITPLKIFEQPTVRPYEYID